MSDKTLASDLLRGADSIAEFVFGSKEHRPKVYHAKRANLLPLFTIGNTLCARKSTLLEYFEKEEKKAARASGDNR